MPKRRGRVASEYARRSAMREPYDYVLIVCEGKKTEPDYLHGLKTAHRLSNANIKIAHSGATDPFSIVKAAEQGLSDENYDRAYCVFDRDGHQNYDQALRRIAESEAGKAKRLRAAVSVPCFEVWLLLHFQFSAAPFSAAGGQSSCDCAIRELRKHIPDYSKGKLGIYDALSTKLDVAIANAERLDAQNKESGTHNPATGMHRLVKYLCGLKSA